VTPAMPSDSLVIGKLVGTQAPQIKVLDQAGRGYPQSTSSTTVYVSGAILIDAKVTTASTVTSATPMYPRYLINLFLLGGVLAAISVLLLLLAPLFASATTVTALMLSLAFGLGVLAFTVKKAERIRDQQ
jgi:hypothetical protein